LGPDPPPWDFNEIYRILMIFTEKWAFNRAGKTVSKIGIYALPPLKIEFLWVFIISLPNFVLMAQQIMFGMYVGYCFVSFF
jgi:hypothetical protein